MKRIIIYIIFSICTLTMQAQSITCNVEKNINIPNITYSIEYAHSIKNFQLSVGSFIDHHKTFGFNIVSEYPIIINNNLQYIINWENSLDNNLLFDGNVGFMIKGLYKDLEIYSGPRILYHDYFDLLIGCQYKFILIEINTNNQYINLLLGIVLNI